MAASQKQPRLENQQPDSYLVIYFDILAVFFPKIYTQIDRNEFICNIKSFIVNFSNFILKNRKKISIRWLLML